MANFMFHQTASNECWRFAYKPQALLWGWLSPQKPLRGDGTGQMHGEFNHK